MSTLIPSLRPYRNADHAMLMEWWKAHGWPEGVNAVCLPSTGVIACYPDQERSVAAAFLYMDSTSPMCWIEWIVTNPDNTPQESVLGVAEAVNQLRKVATAWGYKVCMTTCRQKSLAKLLTKRCGFAETDTGVTHLIQGLS